MKNVIDTVLVVSKCEKINVVKYFVVNQSVFWRNQSRNLREIIDRGLEVFDHWGLRSPQMILPIIPLKFNHEYNFAFYKITVLRLLNISDQKVEFSETYI